MPHLKGIDHITFACATGMIKKWAWFHIEVEGGTLIYRSDDIRPADPDSSMKLWCIDFGSFGVALIEGIDRASKSQVTTFVERHGDHSVQHIAFQVNDLEQFQNHFESMGGRARGPMLERVDGFGFVKQVFARGYSTGNAAEASFPEYVERPRVDSIQRAQITFDGKAGRGFYDQIEDAIANNDLEPSFSFSKMPTNWQLPIPRSLNA